MIAEVAYLNGAWIPGDKLTLPIDDLGFTLGTTVVERLRTFHGKPFRQQAHLERMRRSLEIVGIEASEVINALEEIIAECAHRNRPHLDEADDLAIIALVTPSALGNQPATVCVYAEPLQFSTWADAFSKGVSAWISDVRQVPTNCWPAELKCRSRMHYFLADLAVRKQAPGNRAIMLDQEGYIAESTNANLLIYNPLEGLISPPRDRILQGVTLAVIEELAAAEGLPVREQLFTPKELCAADEVLLLSTSICLLPVTRCNDQPIGTGTPGKVYRQLLAAWNDLVGMDIVTQAERFATRPAT
jgi:branched-chain amino acid aminotransferase